MMGLDINRFDALADGMLDKLREYPVIYENPNLAGMETAETHGWLMFGDLFVAPVLAKELRKHGVSVLSFAMWQEKEHDRKAIWKINIGGFRP